MTNSDVGVLGARRRIRTLESSSSVSFEETVPLRWAAPTGRGCGSAQPAQLWQSADAERITQLPLTLRSMITRINSMFNP